MPQTIGVGHSIGAASRRLRQNSTSPRRPLQTPRPAAWLRPVPPRPRYYDLLDRLTIEQMTVDEWKELTRTDEEAGLQYKMTWRSVLTFLPGFFIYCCLPIIVRYTIYRIWKHLRLKYLYPLQKRWAVMDARLDACLAHMGRNGFRFSHRMVRLRLHGRIGVGRELRYRLGLVMGKDPDEHCWTVVKPQSLSLHAQRQSLTH